MQFLWWKNLVEDLYSLEVLLECLSLLEMQFLWWKNLVEDLYSLEVLLGWQSLFLLSAYYTLLKDLPCVSVIAFLLYVGCYQVSFGPVGWLMISEIFPLRLRAHRSSIALLVNFTSNALVTFAVSPLQDLVGSVYHLCWLWGCAVVSVLFMFFIMPGTRGSSCRKRRLRSCGDSTNGGLGN